MFNGALRFNVSIYLKLIKVILVTKLTTRPILRKNIHSSYLLFIMYGSKYVCMGIENRVSNPCDIHLLRNVSLLELSPSDYFLVFMVNTFETRSAWRIRIC